MEPTSYDVSLSTIGVKVTQGLSEGASEVYARLRALEKESLSKSDDVAVLAVPMSANAPILPATISPASSDSIAFESSSQKGASVVTHMAALGSEIAGNWAKSVAEAGRRREELERSPIYRATEDYLDRVKHADRPSPYSSAHTITATFVIGTTFVGYVGGTETTNNSVSYNIVVDSAQQITPLIPGPGDMRAELGLIGALFAYGAAHQAAWITVGEAEKSSGRQIDTQFAKNYADRLVALCNDQNYNDYLTLLITHHMEGTQQASPEKMAQWVSMVKLGMLLSALALFYQAETGGQSGAEVAGLLNPSADPLPAGDPRASLIAQLRRELANIKDPADRQAVLSNVMQFLDKSKSVKSLTDPVTILLGVFGGDETLGTRRLSQAA